MIAKAGLGLIGLSAISVGGVALTSPWLLGMNDAMPEYHTLDKDHDYNSTYSNGSNKFGKKHGRYLVGVSKESGDNDQKHENWWKWALRRLNGSGVTKGKFKSANIDGAYSDTTGTNQTPKALNQICKEAYGKTDNDFQTEPGNGNDETKFTKEEVWKYCSIGGTKPKTLKEEAGETYDNEKIGHGEPERSKLLSTTGKHNDWIWDLKNKEFFEQNITDNGYFKKEKDKTENKRHLKDICKEAYGKDEVSDAGETKITKTETTKYCSIEQMAAS